MTNESDRSVGFYSIKSADSSRGTPPIERPTAARVRAIGVEGYFPPMTNDALRIDPMLVEFLLNHSHVDERVKCPEHQDSLIHKMIDHDY